MSRLIKNSMLYQDPAMKLATFLQEVNNISLDRYILQLLAERKNDVYMIDPCTDEKLTVSDYKCRSFNLAAQLQNVGCAKATVVAIVSENRLEYPVAIFATILTGAIVTCFNPAYTPNELEHVIDISKPTIVFCSSQTYAKVKKIHRTTPFIKHIIVFDNENPIPKSGYLSYTCLIESTLEINIKNVINHASDTAVILYSSGTTGLPKGVMLSHKNLVFLTRLLRDELILDIPGKTALLNLPMFHAFGFNINLQVLSNDQTLVVMGKFDETLFLSVIKDYKIRFLYLVPTLIVFLLKNAAVENYDLSSVEVIICGAAPIKPETEIAITRKLNLRCVQQGYGLTEFTMIATIKKKTSKKLGTCGSILPTSFIKVINLDTGLSLGPKKNGEICLKGPLLMKGYYGDEKATNEIIDADGWLHTGDIGYYDNDEEFFIVDRAKDLIKYKGFQVAPAELEALLLKHPAVYDAAVIGLPNEVAGEIPKAFVVKQGQCSVSENELMDYITSLVSSHKRIRGGVTFVSQIPKNPSGKILRRKLRESGVELQLRSKY